jgi:hypothetical protein
MHRKLNAFSPSSRCCSCKRLSSAPTRLTITSSLRCRSSASPASRLAVVKEGKIIKAEGYGLANVEHNVAAKPETVYKIGSVSKQFLSTGIMLLVQTASCAWMTRSASTWTARPKRGKTSPFAIF